MAKRYHQSKKDRMDERRGEERYMHESPSERASHKPEHFNDEKHHDRGNEKAVYNAFRASDRADEFYAGSGARRRQEMEDAGYIHEDHNAVANLPQEVIMRSYPKTGPYMPEGLEDSIRGVDHQMHYDDEQRKAHFYPKKV